MDNKLQDIRNLLVQYGQEHLLDHINSLTTEEIEKLVWQIKSIDFDLMRELYSASNGKSTIQSHMQRNITPTQSDVLKSFSKEKLNEMYQIGSDMIKMGKVSAVSMAGGQGTRLGHNGPKGTFKLGAPIDKTLFQMQAEKLLKLSQESKNIIPWYIMTSEDNNEDTIMHFEFNNYFGYPRKDVFFFKQGMLPMLTLDGKIILKEKGEIYFGPDGNGGVFLSLKKSGALLDMSNRGIEWVFFTGIDNALVKMADPIFIGYAIRNGISAASKSSVKTHPEEKAGVFCREDGKTTIIEYSEMPEELLKMTGTDGELLYGDINILVHLFKLDILRKIADIGLPYHKAIKKAAFIDERGHKLEAQEPNSFKFESFIFDALKLLDDVAILRVEREKEFAPIKNKSGEDSPESAIRLLTLLHNNWV